LCKAIKTASSRIKDKGLRIILLTPQGKPFTQKEAQRLSKYDNLIFVCGRYEGFDERVRQFVDEEISIGDYVLMGGELPALVIAEAVMRLRPGILGKDESVDKESFSEAMLEYPQYTKPETLEIRNKKLGNKKYKVPKVLLTGHHKNIEEWRKEEAVKRTKKRRPDLLIDQN
jgi:tRNA (guanine37-N1)-methyltransferase